MSASTFRTALPAALAAGLMAGCAHPSAAGDPAAHAQETHPMIRTFDELPAVDVPPLRYRWTPEELQAACGAAEQEADAKLAVLVAVPDAQRTFASSFDAYEQAMAEYGDVAGRLGFMKDIHPDARVRAAGAACEERAGKYFVKVGARKDLYLAMKGYLANQGKVDVLDPQQKRLIELTLRDFRRNGLDLADADREKLVQIRSRLAELATQYASNLDENTDSLTATRAELEGLPEGYLARLKKAPDGKYIVTTKYPDYFPLMENARSEAVRRRMYLTFNGREAKKNLPLLEEAIALRDRAAKLLGFATHADYVTEDRMARSAKVVADFLGRLREELEPRLAADQAKMLALKQAETHDPKAVFQEWDWRYYQNQIKKRDYALDDEQVRPYFPADKVMAGMFEVYATLLGVSFHEVPGAEVWAPGVKLYEVRDVPSGKLLAKFYVDLFPRAGKYGHAASFPLGVAREVPGGYQIPLSALVVNFNPPENGKSARLSIEEVDTLFHEFGHIMHASLTTARYASQSGTNVAVDFVEAPSQMLENWVYQPEVLRLISEDPQDPSKGLPDDLIKRIVAARKFDAGVRYMRQVFLATFDQYLHTHGEKVNPNVDAIDHLLRKEILRYPEVPEEHFAASFGHLMGGYDAGYYGYLWSEVYADDMFSQFEKGGVLNPALGRRYRDIILAKGRSEEPMALLEELLGRPPNDQAFLRITGIQ